jgi:hypothetical protein
LVQAKRAQQGEQLCYGVPWLKTKIDGVTSPPKRQNCQFAHFCIEKAKTAKMAENGEKNSRKKKLVALFCEKIRLHQFLAQSEQN